MGLATESVCDSCGQVLMNSVGRCLCGGRLVPTGYGYRRTDNDFRADAQLARMFTRKVSLVMNDEVARICFDFYAVLDWTQNSYTEPETLRQLLERVASEELAVPPEASVEIELDGPEICVIYKEEPE
jgi:hypothetical protein